MAKKAARLQSLSVSTDGGVVYNAIQSVVDATLNGETAQIESTTRGSGGYREFLSGHTTATIDGSAAWDEADGQLMALVQSWEDKTTLYYRWRMDTGAGLKQYVAQGNIASLTKGAALDDKAMLDISIQITGTIVDSLQ